MPTLLATAIADADFEKLGRAMRGPFISLHNATICANAAKREPKMRAHSFRMDERRETGRP